MIESRDTIQFIPGGTRITVTNDSVLMSEALYLRYRKVVADLILLETQKKP